MVEVTSNNFNDILNDFEHEIEKSSFFSIDCEYSSLPTEFSSDNSFFDSGEDRYLKLKDHVGHCMIIQVGITTFRFYRDLNHFKAKPYKFYIFPRPFGTFNTPFLSKPSTIQFLCDHKFDFNKVFYDGISYMNRTERNVVINELREGTLLYTLEKHLAHEDIDNIHEICERIKNWLSKSAVGDVTEVPCKPNASAYNFLLSEEIRNLNKDVWASSDNLKVTVEKVSQEQRKKYEENKSKLEAEETLLNSLKGFSKCIDILSSSKKPLVGHNLFIDLLTIYHQFYENLPGSYSTFKKNLNNLFPQIYDTKTIAYKLEHLKNKEQSFLNTSLGCIFQRYQDKGTTFHSPAIILEPNKNIYENAEQQQAHDAGWDSYMTGFIFLKMGDELTRLQRNQKYLMNVTSIELFSTVSEWKNLVSLARAKISQVNIGGEDPRSTRPPLLYVTWFGKGCLRSTEFDAAFKNYEPLHKRPINTNSVLIAVPNFGCFKKILVDFSNSKEFKVEKYSLFRHHRVVRSCLIAGVLVPVAMVVWLVKHNK